MIFHDLSSSETCLHLQFFIVNQILHLANLQIANVMTNLMLFYYI